ncbi:MAG TPA: N-acetylmuramic acid 6-phosphate etherase [Bacteroidota bacterium]|nr:N-acetylmuramic acid 6-phosphate etherase [Bacteroidota bacterium]
MKLLAEELAALPTEQRNPATRDFDSLPTLAILKRTNSEDKLVPIAVEKELAYISKAVEIIVDAFRNGGRLIYVGAGTSGRLGILDAAECPPTYGTDPDMIVGLIAGGQPALFRTQEGAEDDEEKARQDLGSLNPGPNDVVCGIAASRRTPYVVAATKRAKELGCQTVYITTNPRSSFNLVVDVAICPDVGPEVVMGSTRMKSGTAQKLVLNMLTTTAMIKLGKVYENMMVDLQLTNQKLIERAKRIIMMATGVDYNKAEHVLADAEGHVKTAIVMIAANVPLNEARQRLDQANGFVRKAIAQS